MISKNSRESQKHLLWKKGFERRRKKENMLKNAQYTGQPVMSTLLRLQNLTNMYVLICLHEMCAVDLFKRRRKNLAYRRRPLSRHVRIKGSKPPPWRFLAFEEKKLLSPHFAERKASTQNVWNPNFIQYCFMCYQFENYHMSEIVVSRSQYALLFLTL